MLPIKYLKIMKINPLIFTLILFVASCSQGHHEKAELAEDTASFEELKSMDEVASEDYVSSSAAVETKRNDSRKFIRTAELRFKSKNAIKATYAIEEIVVNNNGFVENSTLNSHVDRIETVDISRDSSLVSTYYVVSSNLVLRVPNMLLDTVIKQIASQIDFLNYRSIKANDVSLEILSNALTQQRSAKNEKRLKPELSLQAQEQADQSRINNLYLTDQINFSTINLSIYQNETIKREVIARMKDIESYKPSFDTRFVDALDTGGKLFVDFLVILTNIWPVFVIIILVLIIILYYRKVRNNKV